MASSCTIGDIISAIEKRPSLWFEGEDEGTSFLWDNVSEELSARRNMDQEYSGFQLKMFWVSLRANYFKFKAHVDENILHQDLNGQPEPECHYPFALEFLDAKDQNTQQKIFVGYDEQGAPVFIVNDGLSETTDGESDSEHSDNSNQQFIPSHAMIGNVIVDLRRSTLKDLHKFLESEDLSRNRTDYSDILGAVENLSASVKENLGPNHLDNEIIEEVNLISPATPQHENLENVDDFFYPNEDKIIVMADELEVGNVVEIADNAPELEYESDNSPIDTPQSEKEKQAEKWNKVTTTMKRKRTEEKQTSNKRRCNPGAPMKKCLFPSDI